MTRQEHPAALASSEAAPSAEVWRDPDTGREVPKPAPRSVEDARKALGLAAAPRCSRCGLLQSECDFQRNFPDPEPFL